MKLNREQRYRADDLAGEINGDPDTAAFEIIGMRDVIASIVDMLSPLTHPETKQPIGFHMCFVRDEDMPMLREIAAKGVVRRADTSTCSETGKS